MDNTELLKEHQDERINPEENESSEHKGHNNRRRP